ncbi:MAG: hypothetical protein HYW07_05735 [Candidatus Latescibacteria bacterium]|nr:hypothetical protein [Candidatus Latescibacterota bacterium]
MLKLARFPRGNNRNRPLKQRLPAVNFEAEVERIFRRFWRERGRVARLGLPRGTAEEGALCV